MSRLGAGARSGIPGSKLFSDAVLDYAPDGGFWVPAETLMGLFVLDEEAKTLYGNVVRLVVQARELNWA